MVVLASLSMEEVLVILWGRDISSTPLVKDPGA
jgi:hypothetical protein